MAQSSIICITVHYGRSFTLIALHCCDSPQHLMLRPREQTWNHLNSSADSPFTGKQSSKLSFPGYWWNPRLYQISLFI